MCLVLESIRRSLSCVVEALWLKGRHDLQHHRKRKKSFGNITARSLAPYLSKMLQFRYDQELRFVFGTNPRLVEGDPQVMLLKIDADNMIQDIWVSDEIPSGEVEVVRSVFARFKSKDFSLPKFPDKC